MTRHQLYRGLLYFLLFLTLAAGGAGIAFLYGYSTATTSAAPVFSDGRGCTVYMFRHEGRTVYYADCTERMYR